MPETKLTKRFEAIWKQDGAWTDFVEVMHQALMPNQGEDPQKNSGLSRWMLLPGLCCQAAGGDPHWADDLTAAWILYSHAARILDHVEDKDQPDPWSIKFGPGATVNGAIGLCFTASQILNDLYSREETRSAAGDIIEDFYSGLLKMCSGQHRDLVQPNPTLKQCWEVASAKSGTFFSLACRAGARLATQDHARLEGFSQFGHHLGVIVQILDDLEEIQSLQKAEIFKPALDYGRSLAVVFALEVLPAKTGARLKRCLQTAHRNVSSSKEAYDLIEQCGAGLYLTTELERYHNQALTSLEQAASLSTAREALAAILHKLVSH
jgi:geranylgeranyl diphosphate synthase type I